MFITNSLKADELSMYNININDGLSHNSVLSFYQDERGWMWMGTRNGLNVYTGNDIITYKHIKDEDTSLPNNNILQVTGDKNGHVFVRCENKKLTEYDIQRNTFKDLVDFPVNYIRYDKKLYLVNSTDIFCHENDTVQLICRVPAYVSCLYNDNDTLYIGTDRKGIYKTFNDEILQHYKIEDSVKDILKDHKGNIWCTSPNGGGVYQIHGDNVLHFKQGDEYCESLSSNQTYNLLEDNARNIWITTFNGLSKYDYGTQRFTQYVNCFKKTGAADISTWGIAMDHQGSIWVGSYYQGAFFFNPSDQIYTKYDASLQEHEGLSASSVGRMIEDEDKNIWICTEGGGLNKFNLRTREFTWFKHIPEKNSISHNNVKVIYHDMGRNCLWIGTHTGGLNKLDLKTMKFTCYKSDFNKNHSLPSNIIMDILPYKDELFVVCNDGLLIFNPEDGTARPFTDNKGIFELSCFCSQVLLDRRGIIWLAHQSDGVRFYNTHTQEFKCLDIGKVNALFKDSQGRIWLCNNDNGLDIYNFENNELQNLDVKNFGLLSNTVLGIKEITPNCFIITTDKGYSTFSYEKEFTDLINRENIPLKSLSELSILKTSTNEIFMGGMDGLISLNSDKIKSQFRDYNILPARLWADGIEIYPNDSNSILESSLSMTNQLIIGPSTKILKLKYAVNDFLPYNKDGIEWHLEGLNNQWYAFGEDLSVNFSDLQPGTYKLYVRSKTNPKIKENSLIIKVQAPFYKSIWAYLFYFFILSGIVFFLLYNYQNKIRLKEQIRLEKKNAQTIEEINRFKLRFFMNISNEFRTPLTIIANQIELLKSKHHNDLNLYTKLNNVYINCLYLKDLISELMDFRNLEQGAISFKVSEHNFSAFMKDEFAFFINHAKQQEVHYSFVKLRDNIPLWFDQKQMQKVFISLIFNAFRNVSANGKVTVVVNTLNDQAIVEIIYTGKQISIESLGLSLANSIVALHHGRIETICDSENEIIYRVLLPMGNKLFTEKELNEGALDNSTPNIVESIQLMTGVDDLTDLGIKYQVEDILSNKRIKINSDIHLLVVEDNKALREILLQMFSPFYKVDVVTNAKEAFDMIQTNKPDLIISDVSIPEISGTELCRKIKQDTETNDIPVVLLSSETDVNHAIKCLEAGADDYIIKPLSTRLTITRCNNIVNNRILLRKKLAQSPTPGQQLIPNNREDADLLNKTREITLSHIDDENFNISFLIKEIGISRTKFFNKIKEINNQTPSEFIMEIRLDHAAQLLLSNPDMSISEISDKSGFSSPKFFRRCFKQKFGMPPMYFRDKRIS